VLWLGANFRGNFRLCVDFSLLVLSFRPEFSGLAALKEQRRPVVIVNGDEIIVTSEGFRAVYCRRPIIRSSLSDGAQTRTTMR